MEFLGNGVTIVKCHGIIDYELFHQRAGYDVSGCTRTLMTWTAMQPLVDSITAKQERPPNGGIWRNATLLKKTKQGHRGAGQIFWPANIMRIH